ncbi:hypothetical protein [Sphingobacterium bovistauri]|uniref:Uncharacterized protein n=1 Tax=Sphingobacterium bovistauri TaxID=2781959 RepID=A0ABS7ZD17_9SPHI|nr:hypothetical protein [Sphingobacterium bovistauri]MCA5006775.1 hypothetical protein [Sphingobacterium bovistauri]
MRKKGLKIHEFRVDGNIKPIPYRLRVPISVNTADTYYISTRENIVSPCTVQSTHLDSEGREMAWVIIHETIDGKGEKHNMYTDELGRTPEEAIEHQWNFFTR